MGKQRVKVVLMVNAALEINGDQAQVVVKNIKAKPSTVSNPIEVAPAGKEKRARSKSGKPIHDIILESAKKVSGRPRKGPSPWPTSPKSPSRGIPI